MICYQTLLVGKKIQPWQTMFARFFLLHRSKTSSLSSSSQINILARSFATFSENKIPTSLYPAFQTFLDATSPFLTFPVCTSQTHSQPPPPMSNQEITKSSEQTANKQWFWHKIPTIQLKQLSSLSLLSCDYKKTNLSFSAGTPPSACERTIITPLLKQIYLD